MTKDRGKPGEKTASRAGRSLTEREIEVIKLVIEGLSNQQIADELNIARRTAQEHVSNCMSKLRARSRTQLAVRALRAGIVPLHPEDAE